MIKPRRTRYLYLGENLSIHDEDILDMIYDTPDIEF